LKKNLSISSLAILLLWCACSKSTRDTSGTPLDTVVTQTPVSNLPDTVAIYDNLRLFTQQGASWTCTRFDTMGGFPYLGLSFNSYSGNWQKKLILDTSNKQNPDYFTYKDSSSEIFTVKGTITMAALKKYFFLSNSYGKVNYRDANFQYIADYPDRTLSTDTTTCSILLINNTTRKQTDTEFVFLSKAYFAIMPQTTFITPYVDAVGISRAGYATTDASLIFMGATLSKIKPVGGSFTFQNKIYQGDLVLTAVHSSVPARSISGTGDSTYLLLSKTKGLVKFYNVNAGSSPISSRYQKTVRINTAN
jgi:hypothetical protein